MQKASETRLECLRLAITMAAARVIEAKQVLAYAREFLSWVVADDPGVKTVSRPELDGVLFRIQQASQENGGARAD